MVMRVLALTKMVEPSLPLSQRIRATSRQLPRPTGGLGVLPGQMARKNAQPCEKRGSDMTDGTMERRGDRRVIRFERRLAHPVERVWRALTDPNEIAAWLAVAEPLELEQGGRVVLTWQPEWQRLHDRYEAKAD